MTYEEHKAAVEKAAMDLYEAEKAALQDNIKICANIVQIPIIGGIKKYMVDDIDIGIDSLTRSFHPLDLQNHRQEVEDAASRLADAFTAAAEDNYAFEVYLSRVGGTEAFCATSDFYRYGA